MLEDWIAKLATLVSNTGQAGVVHTLIPAATLVIHRGQVVVVQTFNPSSREEYKTGGDKSSDISLQSRFDGEHCSLQSC